MATYVRETLVPNDHELAQLARQGDQNAFGELVLRHYQNCASAASFILRNRSAGADAVQEACCKAFEHIDQYSGTAEFSNWLHRIVVNHCLIVLRVNRRAQLVHLDGNKAEETVTSAAHTDDPECDLVHREIAEVVRREIRCLPPLLRNVAVLRDIEGLSLSDVATRLRVTVPAVKARLFRARKEVRSRVQRHLGRSDLYLCRSMVRNLPPKPARTTYHG